MEKQEPPRSPQGCAATQEISGSSPPPPPHCRSPAASACHSGRGRNLSQDPSQGGHSQSTVQLEYQAFRVPRKGAPASRHRRAQIPVTSEGCAVTAEPRPCHRCPVPVSLVPASGPALPQASSVSLPPAPEAFTVTVSPFSQEGPRLRHRVERPGPAGPHIHAHCSLPRRPTTRPPPLPQSPATTGSWHAEAVRR